jgi:hypothetical protein
MSHILKYLRKNLRKVKDTIKIPLTRFLPHYPEPLYSLTFGSYTYEYALTYLLDNEVVISLAVTSGTDLEKRFKDVIKQGTPFRGDICKAYPDRILTCKSIYEMSRWRGRGKTIDYNLLSQLMANVNALYLWLSYSNFSASRIQVIKGVHKVSLRNFNSHVIVDNAGSYGVVGFLMTRLNWSDIKPAGDFKPYYPGNFLNFLLEAEVIACDMSTVSMGNLDVRCNPSKLNVFVSKDLQIPRQKPILALVYYYPPVFNSLPAIIAYRELNDTMLSYLLLGKSLTLAHAHYIAKTATKDVFVERSFVEKFYNILASCVGLSFFGNKVSVISFNDLLKDLKDKRIVIEHNGKLTHLTYNSLKAYDSLKRKPSLTPYSTPEDRLVSYIKNSVEKKHDYSYVFRLYNYMRMLKAKDQFNYLIL